MAKAISYSRIKKYQGGYACELEDYWTYEQGRWPAQSSFLCNGSAFHEAINMAMRHTAKHGELPPFGRMLQVYQDNFEREASETEFKDDEDPAEIMRTWGEALEVWWGETAPLYRPHEADPRNVEIKFFLELEGLPRALRGKIDLLGDRRESAEIPWDHPSVKRGVLVDWKTGSKDPSAADLHGDLQPTVYQMAFEIDPEIRARVEIAKLVEIRYEHVINTGPGLTEQEYLDAVTEHETNKRKPIPWNVRPNEIKNWNAIYGPTGPKAGNQKKPNLPRRVRSTVTTRTAADIDWLGITLQRVNARMDAADLVRQHGGENAARLLWVPPSPGHWMCNAEKCAHWAYCRGAVVDPPKAAPEPATEEPPTSTEAPTDD